jgi:hypothetical protein
MDTASNSPGIAFSPSRILLAGAIALCALGVLTYFIFDPTKVSIFPPCIFHQVTGWDCPGCGAQRSLHELLHGHLLAALRLNAMFVLSLPLAAWYGPRLVRRTFTRQPSGAVPTWLWFFIAAWIIFGIARNFPFPVCAWFKA